uniref:ClpX-type ZB domain-containing protein n=1 Tax=Mycena chlorophos TaxID=658473 RepID=A0ABQ0KX48_MYCCL|nr:predicted protein [Mycena chlorophos]
MHPLLENRFKADFLNRLIGLVEVRNGWEAIVRRVLCSTSTAFAQIDRRLSENRVVLVMVPPTPASAPRESNEDARRESLLSCFLCGEDARAAKIVDSQAYELALCCECMDNWALYEEPGARGWRWADADSL